MNRLKLRGRLPCGRHVAEAGAWPRVLAGKPARMGVQPDKLRLLLSRRRDADAIDDAAEPQRLLAARVRIEIKASMRARP